MMSQLAVALLFLVSRSSLVFSTSRLGTYKIDESKISISGVSSGAFFAVQFHVAFSSTIMGVGVTAGGPYYCAQGNAGIALSSCMTFPYLINVPWLVGITRTTELSGTIDPLDGMRGDKILLVSGKLDTVVKQGVEKKLFQYYKYFVNESDIVTQFEIPAQHAMLTDDYGNACSYLGEPFINNCKYSAAYETLQHSYGNIVPATSSRARLHNVLEFDQSEFFGIYGTLVGLDKIGYLYVPSACQTKEQVCRLHIALHGCGMSRELIGTTFVEHAGYNQVAEVNNIIILYPQTRTSLLNPHSCFDWWGYTSPAYAIKKGPQMAAVKAMIDRLTGQFS